MDLETIRQCRENPETFSRELTGQELWPWQAEVARSPARYRCLLAGRRAGKSRLLALLATWTAFRKPNASVVLISAGETASLRVLGDVASLCRSPLLAGSITDELKATVRLSNGSTITSFPASMRQIRGVSADLLVVDEAAFVPRDIWTSALPTIADRVRAGGKVILASTPWPVSDSWFREFHERGVNGDPVVASWHLPSSVNPNIGAEELADMQAAMNAEEYAREILAAWTSEQGAYFSAEEISAAVADYELMSPELARNRSVWDRGAPGPDLKYPAVAGVDYGFSPDSNSVTLISALNDAGANKRQVFYVSHLEAHQRMEYAEFVDRLITIGKGYRVYLWASEINGVGAAPTQDLRRRLREEHLGGYVMDVWTDNKRKQAGFSILKSAMGGGTLVLPRDPDLMRELAHLDYERTPAGSLRIAARQGSHDDRAMSLLQAASCMRQMANRDATEWSPGYPHTVTGRGTVMPLKPRPVEYQTSFFQSPAGAERGREPAW